MGGKGLRCDHSPEVAGLAGRKGAGQDDAGQLHLELDAGVLVEVPVDRVLVVAHGDDERDHQSAAAAGLSRLPCGVEMLPQQAGVFLVQADCLPDCVGLAVLVGELNVEVADFPEAVAAKLERIGHAADPVLADVESVAPALERPRVGVRDEQFCHRGTPDDRPHPAVVLVSDGMQDEALAGGEAQAQPPALPADLPAADLEARAPRLNDPQRLEIVSQRPDAISGIGTRTGRQRHDTRVLHPRYRHLVEVHDGMQAMDRLGVRVVIRPLAVKQQRPHDPASHILSRREGPDPPRFHHHLFEGGDAA